MSRMASFPTQGKLCRHYLSHVILAASRRQKVAREGLAECPDPHPCRLWAVLMGDSHRNLPMFITKQVAWSSGNSGLATGCCPAAGQQVVSLAYFPAYAPLSSAKLGPSGNV